MNRDGVRIFVPVPRLVLNLDLDLNLVFLKFQSSRSYVPITTKYVRGKD